MRLVKGSRTRSHLRGLISPSPLIFRGAAQAAVKGNSPTSSLGRALRVRKLPSLHERARLIDAGAGQRAAVGRLGEVVCGQAARTHRLRSSVKLYDGMRSCSWPRLLVHVHVCCDDVSVSHGNMFCICIFGVRVAHEICAHRIRASR